MFFVSEEFLRKYEAGEAFESTLQEVLPEDERLFPVEEESPGASGSPKAR